MIMNEKRELILALAKKLGNPDLKVLCTRCKVGYLITTDSDVRKDGVFFRYISCNNPNCDVWEEARMHK